MDPLDTGQSDHQKVLLRSRISALFTDRILIDNATPDPGELQQYLARRGLDKQGGALLAMGLTRIQDLEFLFDHELECLGFNDALRRCLRALVRKMLAGAPPRVAWARCACWVQFVRERVYNKQTLSIPRTKPYADCIMSVKANVCVGNPICIFFADQVVHTIAVLSAEIPSQSGNFNMFWLAGLVGDVERRPAYAAAALVEVENAQRSTHGQIRDTLRALELNMRDLLSWWVQARVPTRNKEAYMRELAHAFGYPVDEGERYARLMHSHALAVCSKFPQAKFGDAEMLMARVPQAPGHDIEDVDSRDSTGDTRMSSLDPDPDSVHSEDLIYNQMLLVFNLDTMLAMCSNQRQDLPNLARSSSTVLLLVAWMASNTWRQDVNRALSILTPGMTWWPEEQLEGLWADLHTGEMFECRGRTVFEYTTDADDEISSRGHGSLVSGGPYTWTDRSGLTWAACLTDDGLLQWQREKQDPWYGNMIRLWKQVGRSQPFCWQSTSDWTPRVYAVDAESVYESVIPQVGSSSMWSYRMDLYKVWDVMREAGLFFGVQNTLVVHCPRVINVESIQPADAHVIWGPPTWSDASPRLGPQTYGCY